MPERSDSPQTDSRMPLMKFFDSFLQERNIKWMLGVGVLLLLGSSLRLVTTQWEILSPVWRYLIILSYTGVIYVAGQWCYHHMVIRKTGTMLMALTVLLMPISFVALNWVQADTVVPWSQPVNLGLLILNLGFSAYAANRIFGHFLRSPQPTFVASYLILCLAGALVPAMESTWSIWAALFLWAAFALGSMKVNRHIFWLAEEHSYPRIFGFFPIALLGGQFFWLFAFYLAPHVDLEWAGLGCVLTALPMMLTADTVARVYQQRTGDIVRPLPWPIMLPLGVGILLCFSGLCLAATELPFGMAMAPTSILAAVIMALVARRTGKQGFVWASLICVTLAYNFCHVYFAELRDLILQKGAQAVREERLPFAFYGLTYLPLISACIALGSRAKRAGNKLLAQPVQLFTIVLSAVLLLGAFGHVKALFPVAAVMTIVFVLEAIAFGNRSLILLAMTSWLVAAYGLPAFADTVLGISAMAGTQISCLAIASALLLVPGFYFDRLSQRLPLPATWKDPKLIAASQLFCQSVSLIMTIGLAYFWTMNHSMPSSSPGPWLAPVLLSTLMIVHSFIWLRTPLSIGAILFSMFAAVRYAIAAGIETGVILASVTLVLLIFWALSYLLRRRSGWQISRAFNQAFYLVSLIGLLIVLTGVFLPLFAMDIFQIQHVVLWWPCQLLIVAWAFDAARREAYSTLTSLGCLGVLGLASSTWLAAMGTEYLEWLPAVWASAALLAVPVSEFLLKRIPEKIENEAQAKQCLAVRALAGPISVIVQSVVILLAGVSIAIFSLPIHVTGGITMVALLLIAYLRNDSKVLAFMLAIVNWQLIALTLSIFCPRMENIFEIFLFSSSWAAAALPVALATMICLLIWQQVPLVARQESQDVAESQRGLLRLFAGLMLLWSMMLPEIHQFSIEAFLSAAFFALLVHSELWAACKKQQVQRVWIALACTLVGVGYFASFGVIHFGRGISMYVVLGIGLGLMGLAHWFRKRDSLAIMAEPFQLAGMVMPLVTVGIGIGRHLLRPMQYWPGYNSLALLLAAGFYFCVGLERRKRPVLVLSAIILNIALVLLWRDLSLSDPQFYMIPLGISVLALVEALKKEIPHEMRNPLRYAGALVILVSPTFHIVGGSWLHMTSLMIVSVGVLLVAIGLRIRVLMYCGTAFLIADLIAMIAVGSHEHPNLLWIVGLGLGAAVVVLAAICENNREKLLDRLRRVSAQLEQWD